MKLLKRIDIKYLIALVFMLLILSVGVTYAITVASEFYSSGQSILSGTVSIDFQEKSSLIDIKAMIPASDSDALEMTDNIYKFTIKNTGTLTVNYKIQLADIFNEETKNTVKLTNIKYGIKKDNNDYEIKTLANSKVLAAGNIASGEEKTYEIKFWLDIDTNSFDMGKDFYQKLEIISTQATNPKYESEQGYTMVINSPDIVIEEKSRGIYTPVSISNIADEEGNIIFERGKTTITYQYYDGKLLVPIQSINLENTGVYFINYVWEGETTLTTIKDSYVLVVNDNINDDLLIDLNGNESMNLSIGDTYKELGVNATNNLSSVDYKIFGYVDTNRAGDYRLFYVASDNNGNYIVTPRKVKIHSTTLVSCFTYLNGTITNYDASCGVKVVVPMTIDNINITTIGDNAFMDKRISSINLPSTITKIGKNAFKNNNITNIDFSKNIALIEIGDNAFDNNNITNIDFSNNYNLVKIGKASFTNNNISNLVLDGATNLTTIEENAFSVNNLTTITIPSSVIEIGDNAFQKSSTSNKLLIEIINTTNNSFDWGKITFGKGVFISGTIIHDNGDIIVSSK